MGGDRIGLGAKHSQGESKGDDTAMNYYHDDSGHYDNGGYTNDEVEMLFSKVRHNRIEFVLDAFRRGCDPAIRVSALYMCV
jgi:hypothetical protein